MHVFKELLKGGIIGIANIIPGVSGGTMALVLGIYERLLKAIYSISLKTIRISLGLLKFKSKNWQIFVEELKRIDAFFLMKIGLGAVGAIIILAKIMTYLLEKHHDPTYGIFWGLVAASVIVPYKLIKKKNFFNLIIVIIAISGVVGLANIMSGEDKINKVKTKQEIKLTEQKIENSKEKDTAKQNIGYLAFIFLAGILSISAMILPGISGSFILLLLGAYFEILRAITFHDWTVLLFFSLGCGIGMLLFVRLLNFLLKHCYDATMSFLVGLVIGSLWAIWPFKYTTKVGEEIIYLNNCWPKQWGNNEILTIVAIFLGISLVAFFIYLENKNNIPGEKNVGV